MSIRKRLEKLERQQRETEEATVPPSILVQFVAPDGRIVSVLDPATGQVRRAEPGTYTEDETGEEGDAWKQRS